MRTDCLAWMGELQTHRWSNDSDTIQLVKPWSQGKLSRQQQENLQHLFWVYRSAFTRDIQEFVKMLPEDCKLRDGILGGNSGGESGPSSPAARLGPHLISLCFRHLLGFPLLPEMSQSLTPENTPCSCLLQDIYFNFPKPWAPLQPSCRFLVLSSSLLNPCLIFVYPL
jgi:hypothetical protein